MSGPGSGVPVADYNNLCEGDVDPYLNKKIRTLVLKTPDYIVYLDDDLFVEWGVTKSLSDQWNREWDTILNEVSILEAEPTEGLNTIQVEAYRRMLGEAVARVLDTGNITDAKGVLGRAREWIESRSIAAGRRWYLSAALVTTAVVGVIGCALWVFRFGLAPVVGPGLPLVALGACAGGLGAMASVTLSFSKRRVDSRMGCWLHLFDGGLRIVSGCLGAFFVVLVIKAGMLFAPLINAANPLAGLLAFGFAAGFSERLVPDLVGRFAQEASGGTSSVSSSGDETAAQQRAAPDGHGASQVGRG